MNNQDNLILLEHALGGNWLRLTLDSDPNAKEKWLRAIENWKEIGGNALSWCKEIGRAWDQTPFFHGMCHSGTNSIGIDEMRELFWVHYANIGWITAQSLQLCIVYLNRQKNIVYAPRHESPTYKSKLERMVKEAIRSWNLLSLRFSVPKDLRQKIAQLIWNSRLEWI